MTFNRIILFILLFLPFSALAQIAGEPAVKNAFSLEEAQLYALQNNLNISNSRLDEEIARKKIAETRAIGLPQVDGQVNFQKFLDIPVQLIPAEFFGGPPGTFEEIRFGTNYNLTAQLSVNQLLFDGTYFVGLKAAAVYAELSQRQTHLSELDVKLNVEKAYFTALLSSTNLQFMQRNMEEAERQLFETQQLYENGFVEQLDVDRLQLNLNNLENQINALERQKDAARLLLKFQMGYPMADDILLTDSLERFANEPASPVAEGDYTSNRIEYQLLQTQAELQKLNTQSYNVSYLPSISGSFIHQQVAQRNEFNFTQSGYPWFPSTILGVTLRLPIWDSFTKSAQIQQSKLELEKILNQQDNLSESVSLEVAQARNDLLTAQEQFATQEQNLELAERIHEKSNIKYKEGVGSSLELSTAQSSFYQTQTNYFTALYELLIARAELQKATGQYAD